MKTENQSDIKRKIPGSRIISESQKERRNVKWDQKAGYQVWKDAYLERKVAYLELQATYQERKIDYPEKKNGYPEKKVAYQEWKVAYQEQKVDFPGLKVDFPKWKVAYLERKDGFQVFIQLRYHGPDINQLFINKKSFLMKSFVKLNDEKLLELFRVTLTNAAEKPEVLTALEKSGYTAEILNQGKEMLEKTNQALITCSTNRALLKDASLDFKEKKARLDEVFYRDSVKAKLVYRNDRPKADLLGVAKAFEYTSYIKWITANKKFYNGVAANQEIQQDLARLNITMEQINDGLTKIAEVEAARAHYIRVKGESEDSTQIKDHAINTMRDWMFEFYRIAKLELRKNPQLLESLGKVVKSQ